MKEPAPQSQKPKKPSPFDKPGGKRDMSVPPEMHEGKAKIVDIPEKVEKPKLKKQQPSPKKDEKDSRAKKVQRRSDPSVHFVEPHF